MRISGSKIGLAAGNDLAAQWDWYVKHAGVDIAERYLAAFQATLVELLDQPDLGRRRHFRNAKLKGVRSRLFHGSFRVHLVFYRVEDDMLVVIRILHGMRDLPRRLLEGR